MRNKIPRTIESFVGWWNPIIPQASDDASYGIWGYLGVISLYIWCAIASEQHLRFSKIECDPQAEEINQVLGEAMSQQQNVMFADTHPGYTTDVKSTIDDLRDAPFTDDASLDEFFSRPILIRFFNWQVGGPIFDSFNPWQLYFEDKRVINRISNYKLMTAELHVKFVINGTPFHYGRAIASYRPLPNLDGLTVFRQNLNDDFVGATQRPHIYLDPTNSQGGDMKLPFFYYKNTMDIVSEDWRDLGDLTVASLNPLKHANDDSGFISIKVFAWAENVRFAIPTSVNPGSIVPQADEYGQGIISKPASAIAKAASALGKIPLIRPYARATEIGAQAMANVASAFGYCRPTMLDKKAYRTYMKNEFAVCNGEDDTNKLSVDAKQELTLDPRTVGLQNIDELSIPYIAQRESFLDTFTFPLGLNDELLLWNCIVDPCVHRNRGVVGLTSREHHLPACAFATYPFKFWRGTMKFRFQVVCSKFHKGRIKVVYDPTGNFTGTAEYNTAYTTIVDISDNTDFTIDCGWGQSTTYREHIPIEVNQPAIFTTTPLAYTSVLNDWGNGTIAVYVVNDLTSPNDTVNNDIEINVFVSAGSDFEVAGPTYDSLSQFVFNDVGNLTADGDNTGIPGRPLIEPQAEETKNSGDETDRMDSAPLHAPVMNTVGNVMSLMDNTNLVHFGEAIRSFRTLLKRYTLHEYIGPESGTVNGENALTTHVRYNMPMEPGFTDFGGDVTRIAEVQALTGEYYYAQMTLLRYISAAYSGWRGGIRWLYDSTMAGATTGNPRRSVVYLNRAFVETAPTTSTVNYTGNNFDTADALRVANEFAVFNRVNNGTLASSSAVNPCVTAELPYYSQYRFTPSRQSAKFDRPMLGFDTHVCAIDGWQGEVSHVYNMCSVAEDFTCFFFLGAPRIYTQQGYPSPPVPAPRVSPRGVNEFTEF